MYDHGLEPYYEGVSQVLAEREYAMSFLPQGPHSLEEMLIRVSQSKMVDGLIILVYSHYYNEFIRSTLPKLQETGLPFVVIHSSAKPFNCHHVCLDSVSAGYQVTEHLFDQGYEKPGFVYIEDLHAREFYKGYEKSVKARGTSPEKLMTGPGYSDRNETQGYEYGRQLIKQGPLLDAYVLSSDHFAYGFMQALKDNKVAIPSQVGIAACNNAARDANSITDLTVIDRRGQARGRKAAEILFDVVEKNGIKEGGFISHIEQPELIIRNSSLRSRSEDRGPRTE
jgi:DNA-binding LacI/PurR family transcriptional regulator